MGDDINVGKLIGVAVGSFVPAAARSSWWAVKAYHEVRLTRPRGGGGGRRLRARLLGASGVTALEQALCRGSLDQREEVRALFCGHVFHLRKSAKCGSNIDDWLCQNRMRCPVCCKTAFPVRPWKAPLRSAPAPGQSPSTTDLEAQLPRLPALEKRRSPRPPSEGFEDTLLSPSQ